MGKLLNCGQFLTIPQKVLPSLFSYKKKPNQDYYNEVYRIVIFIKEKIAWNIDKIILKKV